MKRMIFWGLSEEDTGLCLYHVTFMFAR